MQHEDAEVSDITVILKTECAEKFDSTVDELKKLGMDIDDMDAGNGAIGGTVPADKLPQIRAWECVQYVRVEFTYVADYPVGDPRNQDSAEEQAYDSDD